MAFSLGELPRTSMLALAILMAQLPGVQIHGVHQKHEGE